MKFLKRLYDNQIVFCLILGVLLALCLALGQVAAGAQEDPEKPHVEERPDVCDVPIDELPPVCNPGQVVCLVDGVAVECEGTFEIPPPVIIVDPEIPAVPWVYGGETLPGIYFDGPLDVYGQILAYLEHVRVTNEFLEWHYRTYMKVWDDLAWCEARGNWHANTGNGYYGGLQMDQRFWRAYGGLGFAPRADLATREQQIEVGVTGRDASGGYGPWPSCSRLLGLPR